MANPENIVPYQFKPGESGNPSGRPKGSKSLATIIRELENEQFDWSIIPKHGKKFQERFAHMGSPFRVIVMVAALQAIRGDEKAREWLRRAGYGDKLDLTSDGKKIEAPLVVSAIQPRYATTTETETAEGN